MLPLTFIKAEHVAGPESPDRHLAPPVEPQYEVIIPSDLNYQQEAMLFHRHKLQRVFLPRNFAPARASEMPQMVEYLESLEQWENLGAEVIRSTKMHKILKGITRLRDIPLDDEYRFSERCRVLLKKWMLILDADDAKDDAQNALQTQPYCNSKAAAAGSFVAPSSAAAAAPAPVPEHVSRAAPANGTSGDWELVNMMVGGEKTAPGVGHGAASGRWVSQAEEEKRVSADSRRREARQRLLGVTKELRVISEMLAE